MFRPLAAAALALTALTAPAYAATSTFRMDIAFAEAKLATPAGAAAEYASIREQVADRCEAEHAGLKFGQKYAVRACTERTLTNTVRAIASKNLTEVHRQRP
jgi:UrcA family protein